MIKFTSDLHFGHKNIIRFDNRPFTTVEEMDEGLIKRWNNKVAKDDTVYILGDISWHKDDRTYEIFKQLNGHKRLIRGNHDKIHSQVKNCFESIKDYDEIIVDGKQLILSHYPIHMYNHQFRGGIMLYGHVHTTESYIQTMRIANELNDIGIKCNMFNVCCSLYNYEPVSLDEIIGGLK
jgi:calcineurin-like phosphoesterase family protein